jgi:hypothetical protein
VPKTREQRARDKRKRRKSRKDRALQAERDKAANPPSWFVELTELAAPGPDKET